MGSLIGKALALRNQGPPVPIAGSGSFRGFSSMSVLQSTSEVYMQAYASSGTVWQIAHLLASNVAKPEWRLYRKPATDGRVRYTTNDQGSDQRQEVVKHQALTVLTKPAMINSGGISLPVWTRFGLFELSQLYLELTGEAYWVVDRDPRSSVPLGLWPVRPDRMEPVPDEENYLKGWCYTAPDGREKIPLQPTDVIQIKYPNPMDPYRGLGPAQAVLVDIEAARYSAEWNRNYFLNSAEPGGVIQVDHAMDDDEWNDLTDRWRETHRGVARAHRIAVLEAGQTWVPNSHSMRDMDFANLRDMSRDLIREAWGIHKIMLGNSDDVNRANAQSGEEIFANWSISPRLDRWKEAINNQFLPLFGSTGEGVEFDYIYPRPENREADALELHEKSQSALWLIQAGYDPDDVLEAVGLPPMGVAEKATQAPALPPAWVAAPPAGGGDTSGDGGEGGSDGGQGQPQARGNVTVRAAKNPGAKVITQLAEDYPPQAMAWAHHATWSGPVMLPASHIQPDMTYMDEADPKHVADFVKQIHAGKKLKPVVAVKTPGSDKPQLVDGHHRYLASVEENMPVRAFVGTVDADEGPWQTMHDHQVDNTGRVTNTAPAEMAERLRKMLGNGHQHIEVEAIRDMAGRH